MLQLSSIFEVFVVYVRYVFYNSYIIRTKIQPQGRRFLVKVNQIEIEGKTFRK